MGLLQSLLTFPATAPVHGTLWVATKINEAAEAEYRDPAAIRRALDVLEQRLIAGDIDEDTFEAEELVLLSRLERAS